MTTPQNTAERVALFVQKCRQGIGISRAELGQAQARLEQVETLLDKLSTALTKNTDKPHE